MSENLLLNHLLREGITPSFSFPLDVCEFKAEGRVNGMRHVWPNMQQDLKKALSEFSPGKIITVDGEKYKVEGLSFFNPPNKVNQAAHIFENKFSDANKNLKWYNRCTKPNCGFVENKLDAKSELSECPVCGEEKIESGKWYRPEGFAPVVLAWNIKTDKPSGKAHDFKNMKAKIAERRENEIENSGGVKLPAPLSDAEDEAFELVKLKGTTLTQQLIENERNLLSSLSDRVKIRTSHAKDTGIDLIIINSGYQSQGYYVCPDCGKLDLTANGPMANADGHDRPYAADSYPHKDDDDYEDLKIQQRNRCKTGPMMSDSLYQLYLGMTFKTDMILLTFKLENPLKSTPNAILHKSLNDGVRAIKEALITEIQSVKKFINREIGGGLRKHTIKDDDDDDVTVFDIFLYDDVSGGAGLTTSLFDGKKGYEDFVKILKNVEIRLSGSLCMGGKGCDQACVGCLLDFRNKREHDSLDRKNGLRILRYLLYGTIPTIESGNSEENPHEEIDKLAKQIEGDLSYMGAYSVHVDDGEIVISLAGSDNVRIRPISDMVENLYDDKIAAYINEDFSNFSKIFDFGSLLDNDTVNSNSLDGKGMIYLCLSNFYSSRQDVASTINKIMSKRAF